MTENPYATPAFGGGITPERLDFKDLPTPKLKTLRNDSHSIRTFAVLLVIGLAIMGLGLGGLAATADTRLSRPELLIAAGVWLVNLVTLIGFIKRPLWGRTMGTLTSVLMLLGFPIGTLIGVLLLIALSRSKELFGPDRLTHKALEAEWRYRKRNKVP